MLKCDDQKLLLLLDFIQIVAYSSLEWTIPRGRFIEHLSRTIKNIAIIAIHLKLQLSGSFCSTNGPQNPKHGRDRKIGTRNR